LASSTGLFSGIFGGGGGGGGGPVSAIEDVIQLAPILLVGGMAIYAVSVFKSK
jgi:hypothetical protein